MAEPLTPEQEDQAWKEAYAEWLTKFRSGLGDGVFADNDEYPPLTAIQINQAALKPNFVDGKERVSEEEFYSLVRQRLTRPTNEDEEGTRPGMGLGGDSGTEAQVSNLAKYIAMSVPPSMRTEGVAMALDIRPYIDGLMTQNEAAIAQNPARGRVLDGGTEKLTAIKATVDATTTEIVQANARTDAQRDDELKYAPDSAGLSPEAAQVAYQSQPEVASGQSKQAFSDYFNAGGDTLEAPKVSEQEIMDALSLSGSTDILDVLNVTGNYAEQGRPSDPQYVQVGDPLGPSSAMDPGGGRLPNKLSITAAAKYLQSPNVTPGMVKNMQDQLVRAGYMDGINARIVPGDGWDQATNMAWRRALADSYQRGIPLPQLLREQTEQRRANFKPLSTMAQQSMLDQVARSVLGRSLSNQEQAQLIQQLHTLRDQPLTGPNADGSGGAMGDGTWFSESDVAEQIVNQAGGEIGGTAAANAMYAGQKMIEGMFK